MIKSENAKEKLQSKSIGFQHLWCLIYGVMFCWHLTVIWGCKHAKLLCAAVKYLWLLSVSEGKLSKSNKVIKLSRQSSTHAIQALKVGVQGLFVCVCEHMHTNTHFNALSVSNELNLIYTDSDSRLRYYRGSMWGHLRIQKVLSLLHSLDSYYSRHCWSFSSFWSGLESTRKLKHKDTLKCTNTHAQAHINELRHVHNTPTLTVTHSHCLIYFCVSS